MKYRIALFACLLLSTAALTAQDDAPLWKTLSRISWTKEYDETMGFKVDKPLFSKDIKALEGTEVTIRGYIIPVEGHQSHDEFVLSAFPYSMCFFCGNAGPETVMEVYAKKPIKYSSAPVVLRGKLKLNSGDITKLMYALHEAEVVR